MNSVAIVTLGVIVLAVLALPAVLYAMTGILSILWAYLLLLVLFFFD